jgi:putative membrane protein
MVHLRICRASGKGSSFRYVGLIGLSLMVACSDNDDGNTRNRGSLRPGTSASGPGTSATGTASNMGTSGPGTPGTSTGAGNTGATGSQGTSNGSVGGTATGAGASGSSGALGNAGASGSAGGTGQGSAAGTSGSAGATGMGGQGDAGAVSNLDDGQILFALDTLNAGEVNEAQAAVPKLTNADVRDFAQEMIDDHGAARERLSQLAQEQQIPPEQSELATGLQDESQSIVDRLLAAEATEIDTLYVQSQQDAHTEALALLAQLLMAADAEPLRAALTELRASVQEHLDRAQTLPGAR